MIADSLSALERRDVAVSALTDSLLLLQSVDASASIGAMPLDDLLADPSEVGYGVSRTACLELMTLGVSVSTLALAVAQQGDAEAVTCGARRFCKEAGLAPAMVLSSENYVSPAQSSVSVSAVGVADRSRLVVRPAVAGTLLCTLGTPHQNGADLTPLPMSALRRVINDPLTREVIPVGSRGIAHDLKSLNVGYEIAVDLTELSRPGGPGQLVLVLCDAPLDVATFTAIGEITEARPT